MKNLSVLSFNAELAFEREDQPYEVRSERRKSKSDSAWGSELNRLRDWINRETRSRLCEFRLKFVERGSKAPSPCESDRLNPG